MATLNTAFTSVSIIADGATTWTLPNNILTNNVVETACVLLAGTQSHTLSLLKDVSATITSGSTISLVQIFMHSSEESLPSTNLNFNASLIYGGSTLKSTTTTDPDMAVDSLFINHATPFSYTGGDINFRFNCLNSSGGSAAVAVDYAYMIITYTLPAASGNAGPMKALIRLKALDVL